MALQLRRASILLMQTEGVNTIILDKFESNNLLFLRDQKKLIDWKLSMLEHYEIENVEQLRAVADMLRLRIIELLQKKPMTVTQLGEELGEAPAKVHYHVRELEKVGLLRLVARREKGGILEKYYQPIAREISVEKSLLSAPPDEALAMTGVWLNQIKDGFQRALRLALEQKDVKPRMALGLTRLYVTAEEHEQLCKQIIDIIKSYENRRGIDGELEVQSCLILYPLLASVPVPSQITLPSMRNTQIVGAIDYHRADLEQLLTEGKRLHINVIGICRFADDVDADLADHTIEYFHIFGKLIASNAVREVLMAKT
jgi:DNA-binding transcriptional ArsR family regulator